MSSSIPHITDEPASKCVSESAQHTTGVRSLGLDSQSSPAIGVPHDVVGNQKPAPEFKSALDSSPSTPGAMFPGAFPRDSEVGESDGSTLDAITRKLGQSGHESRNITQDVIEKAKEYIPGQENMREAVQHAGETAAQYLPKSVVNTFASYFRRSSSLSRTG
jgi:hypothetical protein